MARLLEDADEISNVNEEIADLVFYIQESNTDDEICIGNDASSVADKIKNYQYIISAIDRYALRIFYRSLKKSAANAS